MESFFSDMDLIIDFLIGMLTSIATTVTGNVILACSVALFILAMVTKFFKRLINGR